MSYFNPPITSIANISPEAKSVSVAGRVIRLWWKTLKTCESVEMVLLDDEVNEETVVMKQNPEPPQQVSPTMTQTRVPSKAKCFKVIVQGLQSVCAPRNLRVPPIIDSSTSRNQKFKQAGVQQAGVNGRKDKNQSARSNTVSTQEIDPKINQAAVHQIGAKVFMAANESGATDSDFTQTSPPKHGRLGSMLKVQQTQLHKGFTLKRSKSTKGPERSGPQPFTKGKTTSCYPRVPAHQSKCPCRSQLFDGCSPVDTHVIGELAHTLNDTMKTYSLKRKAKDMSPEAADQEDDMRVSNVIPAVICVLFSSCLFTGPKICTHLKYNERSS